MQSPPSSPFQAPLEFPLLVRLESEPSLSLLGRTRFQRVKKRLLPIGVLLLITVVFAAGMWIFLAPFLLLGLIPLLWTAFGARDYAWKFDLGARRVTWRRLGLLSAQCGGFSLDDLTDIYLSGGVRTDIDSNAFEAAFFRVILVTPQKEFPLYEDDVSLESAEAIARAVRDYLRLSGEAPADARARLAMLIRGNQLEQAYEIATRDAQLSHYTAVSMIEKLRPR